MASEVPEMLEAQPRLVDRKGNAKRIIEKAPTYPSLQEYMEHLGKRAEDMKNVEPTEDNMLKLSGDARKASLDIRMVEWPVKGERPVPNPKGKIPMAAANVAEIYKSEAANKGTQIVFLDLATPKADDGQSKANEQEGDDDTVKGDDNTAEEQQVVKDAYNIIKRELTAKGVPEEQIAFIHDYDTKTKQSALFDKVRAGDLRVLIGSTGKLGVGVNVQDRAAAIHHIDVPWRPRDIEQREGRIVRQGNKVYGPVFDEETGDLLNPGKGVQIYNYVQEGSFDEFMWQAVQIKGQAIKSLVKRHVTQRKIQDIDPLVLGAAEAKALASGDPRVMRMEELRQKVQVLRLERSAHDSGKRDAAVQAAKLMEQVDAQRKRLPSIETDAALVRKALERKDDFAMTVGSTSHAKRPDADKAIKEKMAELPFKGDAEKVGEYRGLNIMAVNGDNGYQVALVNPATDVMHQSSDIPDLDGASVVTRLDNVMKGIANSAEDVRKKLGQGEESLEFYKGETGKRFSGALDLRDAEKDLQKLRREIGGGEAEDEPEGDAYEVEGDTEVSAIITDSDDEAYDAARATVMGEVSAAMQSGGRDFVMPSQAEVDERIAKELLKQPAPARPEPPAAPDPDPVEEPDTAPMEPVAAVDEQPTVSEETPAPGRPVADEADPIEEIEETDASTAGRAAEEGDTVPGRYDEMLERIRAERDADAAGAPADTADVDPDPVPQETEYRPAETAAEADTVADFDDVPADTPAADYADVDTEAETDTVADVADVPADTADVDPAPVPGEPTQEPDATPAVAAVTDPEPVEEPYTVSEETPAPEPEYAAAVDDVPTDTADVDFEPVAGVEPDAVADDRAAKYESWRKQQLEMAENVFPTEERDALISRLMAAGETVDRAEGRSEEWLAEKREDLTDLYGDRAQAIGEVGARNERQRLLQLATNLEAMAAEAEPEPVQEPEYAAADAMAEPEPVPVAEPDTVSQETPAVEPEPVQEPEYPAADAMAEPEPEPVAEPDTVSQETPAVEPDTIAEPEYAAADAMAEPEPVPVAEPDTVSQETPAVEPDTRRRNRSTPPPTLWRNLHPSP